MPPPSTCLGGGFLTRGAPSQHQQPCWVPHGCGAPGKPQGRQRPWGLRLICLIPLFFSSACVCGHRLMPTMTVESCWGAGQGITSVEHPLWIGLGVSQFCSSTTKQRSQSNMASAGSSQESSTQVSSDLPPVSETLIIVLVSQATVPLSSRGGRVCL